MRTLRATVFCLVMAMITSNARPSSPGLAALPSNPAQQLLPPMLILDDLFSTVDWAVSAEITGSASYTVTQQLTGGYGSPPFRFMSHIIPPVSSGISVLTVNHVYLAASYDPGLQGAISAINYQESGIILSFPFPEAFSTTRAMVIQDGRMFRSLQFIRFIAQNSSHTWETQSLDQLVEADFIAVGGNENDHPDFSVNGSPLQFGFTRTNSRSSTQPPIPAAEDLVIDQGVDNWSIFIHRQEEGGVNMPPQAVEDIFILDGENRSLPVLEILNAGRNDSDPDRDFLEIIAVTQPLYGSTALLSFHSIAYTLNQSRSTDNFSYTISDGLLTSSARVDVIFDCACSVLCLNTLEPPRQAFSPTDDSIDLPLIYRLRDSILKPTADGARYTQMYYKNNPEILVNILADETLRGEAVATVELWQETLRNLVDGDGSVTITQPQVDALATFLDNLSAVSSTDLQQLIAAELARIGPLDDYVGMSVLEAKRQVIGDPVLYLPLTQK